MAVETVGELVAHEVPEQQTPDVDLHVLVHQRQAE
jgi:hypothetical protein